MLIVQVVFGNPSKPRVQNWATNGVGIVFVCCFDGCVQLLFGEVLNLRAIVFDDFALEEGVRFR